MDYKLEKCGYDKRTRKYLEKEQVEIMVVEILPKVVGEK